MSLQSDLADATAALATIDTETNTLGDATTAIQNRINTLLSQIASATDLAAAQALATQAKAEAAKLTTVTDALAAMGSTTP